MFEYERYIRMIHENNSFTRAAEKLYITQPALSIIVKKLEDELGKELFIRTKKKVTLTEAGQRYLDAADEVAGIEKRFRDGLMAPDSSYTGVVRVGGAGVCVNYVIPRIMNELKRKYPRLRIEISEESFYTLREMLLGKKLDLILDSESYHEDISHVRLFPNILLYAVPKALLSSPALLKKGMTAEDIINGKHMSENIPVITLADVVDIPYLSLTPQNELFSRVEALFIHYGLRPVTAMHFNQQLTSYRYAEQGFGAAFVGDTLIKLQPSDKLLFYVFDHGMSKRWISVAYKKDEYISKGSKLFIETSKSVFREEGE
ncbi:MAG: LysR family transcriptional regulator [Sphaerochaetaceae bacterium]|nr:LysR family transcriptional regulator [Sphaerochaetaceae bacterium]